jgi:hypothetical protein
MHISHGTGEIVHRAFQGKILAFLGENRKQPLFGCKKPLFCC